MSRASVSPRCIGAPASISRWRGRAPIPTYLLDRLERLTSDAHQAIYQHREVGLARIKEFFLLEFPRAVRQHAVYVWIATAAFVVPTIVIGWLVYQRPDLILSVVDAPTASQFEQMYSESSHAIGRARTADTDWIDVRLLHPQQHHRRVPVLRRRTCLRGSAVCSFSLSTARWAARSAGYLVERGLASTFFSFVVTHGAFELTAIVLSGAAGLRIGHAVIAPKRQTRAGARDRVRESIVIVYGFAIMLVVAAAIEAFWSSARWMPLAVKYSVAAVCWIAVIGYFVFQGRVFQGRRAS